MRTASLVALLLAGAAQAADVEVRVILHSDIRPGVYGRVDLGSAPPPPVVYREPLVIVQQPPATVVRPVYLHVPPGHAKNWKKHCKKYNACGTPVYFVKSAEYEPKKKKKKDQD